MPIKGIDSDNGSEFINEQLLRYCIDHKISFTRSRPYNKNDGAHVEQKNWARVRQLIGYYRYDKAAAPHQRAVIHPAVRNRPVITMSATFKRLKPAALSRQILALTGEPETVTIARSASARLRILARHPGDHRLRQRGE